MFEASKVPLFKWLQAVTLMVSSKKGISSHQLHRLLGVTLKTAWFMGHRIREAMREGAFDVFGSDGGVADGGLIRILRNKPQRDRQTERHRSENHTSLNQFAQARHPTPQSTMIS